MCCLTLHLTAARRRIRPVEWTRPLGPMNGEKEANQKGLFFVECVDLRCGSNLSEPEQIAFAQLIINRIVRLSNEFCNFDGDEAINSA